MDDKLNKVRVISLKEAADINKKNVAYFTLTDGTVAVVKKESQGISHNYNSQNNDLPKYKKNLRNNKSYIGTRKDYKIENNEYEIYKVKNRNLGIDDDRRNETNPSIQKFEKNYSYNGQIYNNNNLEYNEGKKYQNLRNINISPEKSFSYRSLIYSNQNRNNEPTNISREYIRQQNIKNSQEKGYSYRQNIYQNTNLNQAEYNKYRKKLIVQEPNNAYYNNSNSYKNIYNENFNGMSKNRAKSQNMIQNIRTQPNKNIIKINTNENDDYYQNNNNYKYEFIEAIPVKLCKNSNPQIKKISHPKPQYVQPYINPTFVIQEIKFKKNNNIDFARVYNIEFNKKVTNSFNNFDNDDQRDFRNDYLYKKADLKYSDLSVEQGGGLLKNKVSLKNIRPFDNVKIKNNNTNNSGFRVIRSQNNKNKNCNFKESVGACANIKKFNRY